MPLKKIKQILAVLIILILSNFFNYSFAVINKPFCEKGKVKCPMGTPICKAYRPSNKFPICGSKLGLMGSLSGPGCASKLYFTFDRGAVVCKTREELATEGVECKKKDLCKNQRDRKKSCREDRVLCMCICAFETRNQKYTPRCNTDETPVCAKNFIPTCTGPNNIPKCENGKLFCFNVQNNVVDLSDKITCQNASH